MKSERKVGTQGGEVKEKKNFTYVRGTNNISQNKIGSNQIKKEARK